MHMLNIYIYLHIYNCICAYIYVLILLLTHAPAYRCGITDPHTFMSVYIYDYIAA
jgi:hypothetical protein